MNEVNKTDIYKLLQKLYRTHVILTIKNYYYESSKIISI